MLDIVASIELGDRIEQHLKDAKSPFSMFLDRARDHFLVANHQLLEADLQTSDGVKQAQRLQAEAQRYMRMCSWIADAFEGRESAANSMTGEVEEAAVEELKEQIYGKRDKPAPDA